LVVGLALSQAPPPRALDLSTSAPLKLKAGYTLALTVRRILTHCTHVSSVRQRYLRVGTLKKLSEIVDSRNIIAFIKDTNFYIILILY